MAKKVLQTQPVRSYEIPGGPYARGLGKIDLYVLSEIERGGDDDYSRDR
jgi:hypothetical protein